MRMPPGTLALAVLLAAALAPLACGARTDERVDRERYLEDLDRLQAFTATTYGNFEWALSEGGFDPVAADGEARRAIRAATSDEEAAQALHDFVDGFGDGHFRLRAVNSDETANGGAGPPAPDPGTPAPQACSLLGYEEHDQSFRLDLGDRFQWVTAPDDPFPAGWIQLGGQRVGIVRIDEFGANRFGEYCPGAWESYRRRLDGPCADFPCRHRFELEVVDRLLAEITARIAALEAAGMTALAVDLTGNGGGSDWIEPTARMLTGRTLRGGGRSVVRHPHWVGVFGEMLADVDHDLARDDLAAEQRRVLEEARARLGEGMAEAAEPCDLSAVWSRGAGQLPCTLLVRGKLYSTGLLPEPPTIETAGLAAGTALFKALDYGERAVVWRGPLALLIDWDSASATEGFAALLRDNDAATLIGHRTAGVGCGYTNGGIQTALEHSGLEVWLSDCVLHRRDGGNARAGIEADLRVGWVRGETAAERGARYVQRLTDWTVSLAPPPGGAVGGSEGRPGAG